MRVQAPFIVLIVIVALAGTSKAQDQKGWKLSPRILSARSVYLDDRIGMAAVKEKTVSQLKKWGRYRLVQDRTQADLVLLLSANPYKGGYIIFSGGQTGTLGSDGKIEEDPVPTFNKLAPVRYAYLTVIDPRTGESLWNDSHQWGGLLTGFNSVGAILVKKLEKKLKK